MIGIYHCSPTNSTAFTECCDVAINDNQSRCPVCKRDVLPFCEDMTETERDEAYARLQRYGRRPRGSRS